ncbi:MAG TPA: hypothetical protein VN667_20065 [Burkholderiales bacterium]|nr:hypothetical protein [Burkholderiales bacterium]
MSAPAEVPAQPNIGAVYAEALKGQRNLALDTVAELTAKVTLLQHQVAAAEARAAELEKKLARRKPREPKGEG